jgi:GT2 family glycosyltransferase
MNTNSIKKMTRQTRSEFTSIIILNYNGGKIIMECIKSIYEKTHNIEIIIIDNNSSDSSNNEIKEKYPNIILIENKKNLGMTARNLGINIAKGEFIVFLDSDTIVQEKWLDELVNSYIKNGDGLYQPKLLDKENPKIINSAGNQINIFGLGYSRGKTLEDNDQFNKFQKIGYTSGACTFTSSKIIKKIGKIDQIFFAYHDDLDYGWRAWLQGIPSYYEPKSIVYHLGSPTLKWSQKKFYLLERNRWICLFSCYSTITILKLLPSLFLIDIGLILYFLTKGLLFSKIKANFSIIGLYSDIKKRKISIQKTRKIKDNEIIKEFLDDFSIPTNITKKSTGKIFSNIIKNISKITRKII